MNYLEEARLTINEVDAEMARLFVKRMEAVRRVIAYKIEQNLPIYDAAREQAVLEQNCAKIADETLSVYYRELLVKQMELSKRYQQQILEQAERNREAADEVRWPN